MSAVIVTFPATAPVAPCRTPIPVVTISRYVKPPAGRPWKVLPATSIVPDFSGWVVEGLNHPGGGIAILGHFRNEDAWQQANIIAQANGWQAIRNHRMAIAAARDAVREARR
jgi:hypothetical protein